MIASTHPPTAWPSRISVIGAAGLVGSSVVTQLAVQGFGHTLYAQDRRDNVLEAHRLDQMDAQVILGRDRPQIIAGSPPDGDCDLVIVAASLPENPDADRRDFLAGNTGLLESLAEEVKRQVGESGVLLLLTNPVDILADWLCREQGFDPDRVIGYALNDTARFRQAIAREVEVPPSAVDAMVLGEHGKGQVPIFSTVTIHGHPVDWPAGAQDRIRADIDGWFQRYSKLRAGRSSGWATGHGVAHLVQGLMDGQSVLTTASTRGIDGFPPTFMALPTRLHAGRFRSELPTVSTEERGHLINSATNIHDTSLSIPPRVKETS